MSDLSNPSYNVWSISGQTVHTDVWCDGHALSRRQNGGKSHHQPDSFVKQGKSQLVWPDLVKLKNFWGIILFFGEIL